MTELRGAYIGAAEFLFAPTVVFTAKLRSCAAFQSPDDGLPVAD
ncbi:MAG TPA: hypothetical protein VGO04_22990 [Ensifer sp.]|nr:hypothetical protein [Ensifer sp.]